MDQHVELLIEYKDGRPRLEPVHAVRLGDDKFVLSYSPGFVEGIAAGDEFRLIAPDGQFEVVKRAGNIAVQVYFEGRIPELADSLIADVDALGGWIDGRVSSGMVFTIPYRSGVFRSIAKKFGDFVKRCPGAAWMYGNIYDPRDRMTPVRWWGDENP